MSLNTGALRRLSLLAGSSIVAASLSAVAFTGAAVAPGQAQAANECAPIGVAPSANGPAPDSYDCAAGGYATGVTYDSEGDLTVTKTNTGTTTVTANGVTLTGHNADSVTWDSSIGTVSGGASTNGPVIDVATDAGNIDITTASVSGSSASVTHGVRATSTSGGDVSITRTSGSSSITGSGSEAAIAAVSNGGDIDMSLSGQTAGRLRSIVAQTSGLGDVTLNIAGSVRVDTTAGLVMIDTVAGAGSTRINITSGDISQPTSFGGANSGAAAIRSISASTSSSAVDIQNTGGSITGPVDFSGVAGGVVFNNVGPTASTGRWIAKADSVFGAGADSLTMSGVGENLLDDNGSIDFGAGADSFIVTGGATFNIGDPKITAQAGGVDPYTNPGAYLYFGAGDDLFMLDSTAIQFWQENTFIDFGAGDDTLDSASMIQLGGLTNELGGQIDFGTGDDTFNNSGIFAPNGTVTLSNLETFNNSGTIYFGLHSILNQSRPVFDDTDGMVGDVIHAQGAAFTGSGDSRLVLDVRLDSGAQESCATPTGVSDCLDLTGGATAGQTLVTINDGSDIGILGAYNPTGVTIVDVNGGASDASHFVLDPDSPSYLNDPTYGGVLDQIGLFVYALRYDADTQRHKVVGLPRSEAMEYAMLSSAAGSVWHMTADTVTDRQTDLRAGADEGSLWMRASGEYTKRDVANTVSVYGQTYGFDESYKLYAGTLVAGLDFFQGDTGTFEYVVGGQIGYVGSSFDLSASPSSGRFTGATGGLYGSLWNSRAFLDGTLNFNGLTLDYDAPGLGTKTNTFLNSVGLRLDAGTRWLVTDIIYVEPLASFAFVRTGFEEISLFGGEVKPEDSKSARGALGVRVGGDYSGASVNASYYLTGRAWNEFEGKSGGSVVNPGVPLAFMDDASGAFGEAEAGISLYNDANTLSGFASTGVKWKDGYSAIDLSLGLRMAW